MRYIILFLLCACNKTPPTVVSPAIPIVSTGWTAPTITDVSCPVDTTQNCSATLSWLPYAPDVTLVTSNDNVGTDGYVVRSRTAPSIGGGNNTYSVFLAEHAYSWPVTLTRGQYNYLDVVPYYRYSVACCDPSVDYGPASPDVGIQE